MKFSLKTVALGALLASAAVAAPIEKRDASDARIIACFVGLVFTGAWPGSCQAAIAVDIGLIKSIAVNQMSMDFTPSNPWAPTLSSSDTVATMLAIPGVSLPIDSIRQHIIISDSGTQLGNFDTPWSAASVSGANLKTTIASSVLNVFANSHTAFSSFVTSLSTKASHPVTLQGTVDAELNLGIFGKMTISGIGFKTDVPFAGLNLKNVQYVYMIDTNFDTPGSIILTSIVNIKNPSKLSLKLGDVNLSTATTEGYVGISALKGLTLVPGDNYLLSTTTLDMSLPASSNFLSALYSADVTLTLTGYAGTSTNPALHAGLGPLLNQLVIPKAFEGLAPSKPAYKDFSLKILTTTKTDFVAEVTATFQSPYYGFPVKMLHATGAGFDNYGTAVGVSPTATKRAFTFQDTLQFTVSGTGAVTVTFKVLLAKAAGKAFWQELVTYGTSKGYVPIEISSWLAQVEVNGDGVTRVVDWSYLSAGIPTVNVAVGSDFASILQAFP
ncbi:hypothetical protein BGZ65_001674 [Modicella reniformis]|uniref:Uncharacterized protein n=1 Tax=Modicella reniformis TaxID=1440133 RepID=A0A9P6SQL4_9FUNG|nr:hypothetical protein BGZ65_001674 [Modicella reniformis]